MNYQDIISNPSLISGYTTHQLITLTCCGCGEIYLKPKGNIQRAIHYSTFNYCVKSCKNVSRRHITHIKVACNQCGIELERQQYYINDDHNFCNRSCAATYHNLHRPANAKKPGPQKKLKQPRPPFSTLFKCTCKHCGVQWRGRTQKRLCEDHEHLYSHEGRAKFWFTFGISQYPELFDGELLRKYGMRSLLNPYGVTRDHKVSVNEAIANNYDPYYIKHPINCELMLFADNVSKHTKSSISYTDLVRKVDAYDFNGKTTGT